MTNYWLQKQSFDKSQIFWLLASLLFFAVISACLFANYTYAAVPHNYWYASDLLGHLDFVKTMTRGHIFVIPHPGFHILVILFSWLSSASIEVSAIAVLTIFLLSAFAITYICLRSIIRLEHAESLLITWVVFLVSAIYLPFFSKNMYLGQGTPNIWHNPTFIAQKPFAILIFFLTILLLPSDYESSTKKRVFILAFLLFVSVWIKPNFAITFIPSLLLYIFLNNSKKFKLRPYIRATLILLPSIISLILQYIFTYRLLHTRGRSSVMLGFLTVWKHFSPNPFVSFLLGIAFPLLVVFFRYAHLKRSPFFKLAASYTVIALLQMAFLAEKGYRLYYGNFAWSYYMGLYFVFVVALIEFHAWIRETKTFDIAVICKMLLPGAALLIHLASGVYYLGRLLMGFPYD